MMNQPQPCHPKPWMTKAQPAKAPGQLPAALDFDLDDIRPLGVDRGRDT